MRHVASNHCWCGWCGCLCLSHAFFMVAKYTVNWKEHIVKC